MSHLLLRGAARNFLRASSNTTGGLPYRIRAPLAKLQEKKKTSAEPAKAQQPMLGDGEQLEAGTTGPDYMRLALTSRVYDMVSESPMQPASSLSQRFGADIHLKREDMLPAFSYKTRGAYNLLSAVRQRGGGGVVTWSVGSQGRAVACCAQKLGLPLTVVMPARSPVARRKAIEQKGGTVVIHGTTLADARAEAIRLAASSDEMTLLEPHDDPHVVAGQATAGLEIVRQFGAATKSGAHLDAIFTPVGGGSLIAGVAVTVKALSPTTKVIGVEPEDFDVLRQSLNTGHRVSLTEPPHFVDGAAVQCVGPEVFRLCNELVDDVVTVSNDEICAAVRDCFEDTRAMLEPAGAMSVAGMKKYLAARPADAETGAKGTHVAILSDSSNIEFDIFRFIAERAAIGEQKEALFAQFGAIPAQFLRNSLTPHMSLQALFALHAPDESGMFYKMYQAVQPRLVTEFVYRHAPDKVATVFMSIERADELRPISEEVDDVIKGLADVRVKAVDITGNELAKTHARYLAGSRPGVIDGERLIRFEFPETAGALDRFLQGLRDDWFLTLLHYRNHGGQVGKVLAGVRVPAEGQAPFYEMLDALGCTYYDETENRVFTDYMR